MSIKVLIAEDDADLQHIWSRAFRRAEGFDVRLAVDGSEALKACCEDLPDVLVTDYHMPGMNGTNLVRSLRAMPNGDGVRVIMVTADHGVRFHEDAELVDIFLLKPISYQDLVQFAKRLRSQVA